MSKCTVIIYSFIIVFLLCGWSAICECVRKRERVSVCVCMCMFDHQSGGWVCDQSSALQHHLNEKENKDTHVTVSFFARPQLHNSIKLNYGIDKLITSISPCPILPPAPLSSHSSFLSLLYPSLIPPPPFLSSLSLLSFLSLVILLSPFFSWSQSLSFPPLSPSLCSCWKFQYWPDVREGR